MGVQTSKSQRHLLDLFLLDLYQTRQLTPKLWLYIKSKHPNVCAKALLGDDLNDQTFVWFSPLSSLGIEGIKSAKQSGYFVAYPILEKDWEKFASSKAKEDIKIGGTLLVREDFISNLLSCAENKSNDIFWYNLGTFRFGTAHTTVLLYNAKTKQFEYYDPLGYSDTEMATDEEVIAFGKDQQRIELALTVFLQRLAKEIMNQGKNVINVDKPVMSVSATCPRKGPQYYQDIVLSEFKKNKPELSVYLSDLEMNGFCQVWSMIILNERLSHPHWPPEKVSQFVLQIPKTALEMDPGILLNQKIKQFLFEAFQYLEKRNLI